MQVLRIYQYLKLLTCKSYTGAEIKIIKKNNDPRSYRLDSTKLINTGFKPIYGVETAIQDLISMYNSNKITESDINNTVKWMKKKRIV